MKYLAVASILAFASVQAAMMNAGGPMGNNPISSDLPGPMGNGPMNNGPPGPMGNGPMNNGPPGPMGNSPMNIGMSNASAIPANLPSNYGSGSVQRRANRNNTGAVERRATVQYNTGAVARQADIDQAKIRYNINN